MSLISQSAAELFQDEFEKLLAMVLKRISIECESHEKIKIKPTCPIFTDYVRQFGKLLRIVFKYNLMEALREEIKWYVSLFLSKNLGINGINMLLDSWIITIQGWLKSPECNELAKPLLELKREIKPIIEGMKTEKDITNQEISNFVNLLISEDFKGIIEFVSKDIKNRTPTELITELTIPTLETVGALWERDKLEIFEEHLATINIERLLNYINFIYQPEKTYDYSLLISCVPGDYHDLATKSLSSFLELMGWRVKNLGRGLPSEQILKAFIKLKPHVLILLFTMISMLDEALETIDLIKNGHPNSKIIIGGKGAILSEKILTEKGVIVAKSFEHCHETLKGLLL